VGGTVFRVSNDKNATSNEPDGKNKERRSMRRALMTVAAATLAAVSLLALSNLLNAPDEPLTYSEVFNNLEKYSGWDADISISGTVTLTEGDQSVTTNVAKDGISEAVTKLDDSNINVTVAVSSPPNMIFTFLTGMIPVIVIIMFLYFLVIKRGGLGGLPFGKGRNTPVEVPETRFTDVAGSAEARRDLEEIVEFLSEPERFTAAGARMPHGYLLVGPPGTGKTLLARAVAGEAGVPFYAIAGSDLVEMFVGLGASRVRDLFSKAREGGKAIIFIDEIDAIGRSRSGGSNMQGNDEREQTLNSLLVEMDGFSKNSSIIVLAATNRPEILDSALMRPGRFDRKIVVTAPDKGGRIELLNLYLTGKNVDEDVNVEQVARQCVGMTGADIEQLVNEAALEAARDRRSVITGADLSGALGIAMLGRERTSAVLTDNDRTLVAWHEGGHTVAALCTPGADAPVTVSIIPRGPSGGATWMEGSEDEFLTKSGSKARLVVALAGRASEEILLDGDFTHGAHGDIASASSLATTMITKLGMGTGLRAIGDDTVMLGGVSADAIGVEVNELLQEALDTARETLREHRGLLDVIVAELLARETLNRADIGLIYANYTQGAQRETAQ
jgi:cell division protease FtsH